MRPTVVAGILLSLVFILLASHTSTQAQPYTPTTPGPVENVTFSGPVFDGEGWLVTATGERAIGFAVYNGTTGAQVELVSLSDSRQPLVCSQQPGAFVCLALLDGNATPSITLRITDAPDGLVLPVTVTDGSRTVHRFAAHLQRAPALDCTYLPQIGN